MALILTNNASSLLSASITAGATSLAITSGDEAMFPVLAAGDWCPLTVYDGAGNLEIMRCTARVGTTLTVVRAQEGTSALSFTSGARVDVRVTAATIDAIDRKTSGSLTVDMTGGVDKTATDADARNVFQTLIGAITANVAYKVPAAPQFFIVENQTTGAFDLTVKTPLGTGIVIPQGYRQVVRCDGINVVAVSAPINNAGIAKVQAAQVAMPEQAAAPAAVGNTGLLYTKDVAGVTELYYKDSTGAETRLTTGGLLNAGKFNGQAAAYYQPMTAQGDLIVGGAAGVPTRMARGAAGTYPRSNGTSHVASAIDAGDVTTGTFNPSRLPAASPTARGGVQLSTDAEADTGTAVDKPLTPANFAGAGRLIETATTKALLLPGKFTIQAIKKPGSAAQETLTWPVAWADSNYAVAGMVNTNTVQSSVQEISRTATTITVSTSGGSASFFAAPAWIIGIGKRA